MLIFPKIECMYQPVCKVATNSLIDYFAVIMYGSDLELKPFEIRKKIHDDFNVMWSRQVIATEEYKTYYKIAFVRNPWTRAVAGFRELLRRDPFGGKGRAEKYGLTYEEMYHLMQGYISFDNFINFIVYGLYYIP